MTGSPRPASVGLRFAVGLAAALAAACTRREPAAPPPGGPRFAAAAPEGAVDLLVREAVARAADEHRRIVVYVGAGWCEPCERVHRAVEKGDLDATLPGLTLLEFDYDRDKERLAAAGYVSRFIPLFALPGPDGRASGRQVEGGIKGDGAVAYI